MGVTPWDLRLAARTAALSAIALSIVGLVEGITDERGVAAAGTGGRAIGVLPLAPVAGAIAVVIALAPTVASGELRALAALGCSPWRARVAPVVCALSLALVAGIGIAAGAVDVAALFPPPIPASDYRIEGDAFVSDRRRVRIGLDDRLERTGTVPAVESTPTTRDRRKRIAAATAIALAGVALALWAAAPMKRRFGRAVVTLTAWAVGEILAFQAAGAGAVPPLATALPSLILLALLAIELHLSRNLAREEGWI